MGIKNALIEYKVIYYPKFYCELNYIEYFWYNKKIWIYEYTLKGLRENLSKALKLIKSFIILEHYNSYFKKTDLYKEKV